MPKRLVFPNVSSRFASSAPGGNKTTLEPASHIPSTFTDGQPLPKLFVFDLDYTLWPFWVDTHVSTPIKPLHKDPTQNTVMVDRSGEHFSFYREVPGILHAARARGITMGLASRTCTPDLAEKMLRNIVIPVPDAQKNTQVEEVERAKDARSVAALGADKTLKAWDYFTHREIFPGSKIKHFNKIQTSTARKNDDGGEVAFADMIFFDDEGRNREVETQLGVTFVLVCDGVTMAEVDRGVREWRRRRGFSAKEPPSHEHDHEAVAEL